MTDTYWTGRGTNVIGTDALELQTQARQASTYIAIAQQIIALGVSSVLDMGCNVAALGMFLKMLGYKAEYIGLDNNPHALDIANREGFRTIQGDVRVIAKLTDCVVMKDVLEHLDSIHPLNTVFRNTKRYAIVATYLPWHNDPQSILRHQDGYYTNLYNWQDIITLAKECGFRLLNQQTVSETNGTPNLVTLWQRSD